MSEGTDKDSAADRARFTTPVNVFRTRQPAVPAHAFHAERDAALAPDAPTGLIDLDLAPELGMAFPATSPAMLCRYLVVRRGDRFATRRHSTGTIHHVLRGSGETVVGDETIEWRSGDTMLLPGGIDLEHRAGTEAALLFLADDEPALRFYGATPPASPRAPILYRRTEVEHQFDDVYQRDADEDLAGKAVFLTHDGGGDYGTASPSMVAVFNSLESGADQRAHRHNAAAISLVLQGEGVHSFADGVRSDWLPWLVLVTPPTALHSIHNRGSAQMRVLTMQDSGLFYYLRATGFSFG
jgi:gentisate 1,2-dioxygenase